MKVYQAINAVQSELSKTGISKDSENTFDKYKFRGIDAVFNALSPLLAKHGLCILPRMVGRTCEERQSQKGGALFYVTVEAEFDFVCAEDGSTHTVRTYGEAMDRGDKATNKAMSAAYKYAAFQAFAIPTEGDNDADATSHEVQARDLSKGGTYKQGARDGIGDDLPQEDKDFLKELAAWCKENIGTAAMVAQHIAHQRLDSDQRVYLENQLDSKTRAAIKKGEQEIRAAFRTPEPA